jgi:hypothetical protein
LVLSDPLAPARATLDAFRSAKYGFETAIASIQGTSTLPEKDNIVPNQKSWLETANWMGAK